MLHFLVLLVSAGLAQASYLTDHFKTEFSGRDQGVEIRVFSAVDSEVYYQPAAMSLATSLRAVEEFRKEVRSRANTDPYVLLKNQRAVFEKYGAKEYLQRFDRVLAQRLEVTSFLEEILFEQHSEVMGIPLFGSYSEFGANILIGPQNELVIIFISNPSEAMVPANAIREEQLKKYLALGYRYKIHIHNHPFNFTNPDDVGGSPVPSGQDQWGDVGTFLFEKKTFNLENAWITNGFNTLRIPAQDFDKY